MQMETIPSKVTQNLLTEAKSIEKKFDSLLLQPTEEANEENHYNLAYSQDASFTQSFFNPMYLNPAFAGSNEGLRINANYRNQWTYMPGTYTSTTFFHGFL
jgi:hypothetical protein